MCIRDRANDSCHAVNYETGLCVLFASNADNYPGKPKQCMFGLVKVAVGESAHKVNYWAMHLLSHHVHQMPLKRLTVFDLDDCLINAQTYLIFRT